MIAITRFPHLRYILATLSLNDGHAKELPKPYWFGDSFVEYCHIFQESQLIMILGIKQSDHTYT